MPELPEVTQTWAADTDPYVAALDAAIAASQAFVSANHDALASLAELQAGINALHGTEVRIGVDASAASAGAAAAATREMEAAAADAAAALAAEAAATYEDTLAKDGLIRAELAAAAAAEAAARGGERAAAANADAAIAARRTLHTYSDLVRENLQLGASEEIVWAAMQAAAGATDALAARNEFLVGTEKALREEFAAAVAAIAEGELAADGAVEMLTSRLMEQVAAANAADAAAHELAAGLREVTQASIDAAAAERLAADQAKALAEADAFMATVPQRAAAAQRDLASGLTASAAAFQTLGQAEAFIAGEQEKLTAAATALRDTLGADSAEAAAFAASLAAGGGAIREVAAASDSAGNASRRAMNGFTAWLGGLSKVRVALFGGVLPGILGSVSGLHLLADAALEVTAVVVPAAIALGAFGIAAAPTIQDIVTQMKNLYTVTTATGQAIYPMTGTFTKVADAVRPQVYQLFGEAIATLNHNTGTFMSLATGAGSVLDQLGARMEMALTSGNGFHVFLANATTDLAKLGDMAGNVFGTLGNLLRVVPGYAQYMLTFADSITRAGEAITGSGLVQGLLHFGLQAHGAIVYGGLAATMFEKLLTGVGRFPGLLSMASDGLASAALAAGKLGGEGNMAEHALGSLSSTLSMAQGLPWGWITLGAAALGVLTYAFVTAKDAADTFIASFNQQLASAPLSQVPVTIASGIATMSARMATARATMDTFSGSTARMGHALAPIAPGLLDISHGYYAVNNVLNSMIDGLAGFNMVSTHTGTNLRTTALGAAVATHDYQAYANEITTLNRQAGTFHAHLAQLTAQYGSTSTAMGLLNAAGITSTQMINSQGKAWAQVLVQVAATAAGYRAMGQTGGMLGADMAAMNVLASDQYTSVMKLNQAWGTWIQTITGGMGSLAQFETALGGMASDSATASASLSGAFSTIKQSAGTMTYTLRGFGPAAQQSWQQFTAAVNQGNTVIDQMRTYMAIGAIGNQTYTSTIKGVVGGLLQFTQGNQAALTMVDNLAVQAGYKGPAALRNMAHWAGVAGNTARNQAAKGMETATVAAGKLSTVAKNLATTLNSDLTAMMSQAQIKASGLQQALDNIAGALQHGGSMANGYHGALIPVISSMLKLHQSVPAITTELQAMGVQITQGEVAAIIAAGHLNSMNGSVRTVTQSILNSITAMQQYQSWLNSLHGKTIYVNTVFTSTYVGQTNAAGQTTFHHRPGGAHGGIVSATGAIHAASGAVIPGFAPGRDIVPAWLSPGEAILNPYATRMLGPGFIHMLNTMAERGGGVNPAALQTQGSGGGGFGFGGGMPVIENHLYLDGQEIFANQKVHTLRYNTRNSGARTGAVVPGTTPQV